MDELKEAYSESDKEEVMEVIPSELSDKDEIEDNPCERSDKEEIEDNPRERSDKEEIEDNPREQPDKAEIEDNKRVRPDKMEIEDNSCERQDKETGDSSCERPDKEETEDNSCERLDKEEIEDNPCERPDKDEIEHNPCERPDKGKMDFESSNKEIPKISSNEPLNNNTIDVFADQPSDKDSSCTSRGCGKDKILQSRKKLQSKDSKFSSTKRTRKETRGAPESPDSDKNSPSVKKLILEAPEVTAGSSSTKGPEKTVYLSSHSYDHEYSSIKFSNLSLPGPSTSSEFQRDVFLHLGTAAEKPKIRNIHAKYQFLEEHNLGILLVNGRYYNKRTTSLYAMYLKESIVYAEVSNPRCLYSNTYRTKFGLKYFPFPFSHILIKDLLDLIDFFNGTDAFREEPSDTDYTPDEWELQYMRPNFETGVQHLEAIVLNQLETQFDKLVFEKLFGPESSHKLDESFFRLKSVESEELKMDYTFEPELLDADFDFMVTNLNTYNNITMEHFSTISRCLIAFLKHLNLSRSESVEIDAARFTMAVLWMLRKLLKLRKVINGLLKMKGNKYSCLSTCYILKVKYHTMIYFQALLIKITKLIKEFGFDPKDLLNLLK